MAKAKGRRRQGTWCDREQESRGRSHALVNNRSPRTHSLSQEQHKDMREPLPHPDTSHQAPPTLVLKSQQEVWGGHPYYYQRPLFKVPYLFATSFSCYSHIFLIVMKTHNIKLTILTCLRAQYRRATGGILKNKSLVGIRCAWDTLRSCQISSIPPRTFLLLSSLCQVLSE